MKKETSRGVLLLFLFTGFWVMMLALVAPLLGIGFVQGQQSPNPAPQGTVPPFGITPQLEMPPTNANVMPGGAMLHGQPFPGPNARVVMGQNNAMLPNHAQATYNTATQEVNIPFQFDTSRWLAFSVVVDNNVQTLTVVDPVNQSIAVYHVYLSGPNTGKFELKSVRNISADLKYDAYEPLEPHPAKMRALLEQKEK